MRTGIGIGIPFSRVLGGILSAFKSRVEVDSGTFEADSCLQTTINNLQAQGLYDKASLIVTPNAYKASKIYSIKPTSGAGDLTFARASAQTRRNSAGIIENLANNVPALDYPVVGGCPWWNFPVQRTNSLLWSEEFDNSYWSKINSTINPNTIIAPDGNITADTLTINSGATQAEVSRILPTVIGKSYVFSFFGKKGSGSTDLNSFRVLGSTALNTVTINWDTGVISQTDSGATAEFVGNGWYRIIIPFTANSTSTTLQLVTFQIYPAGVFSYRWGAQLELGAYASPYMPTSGTAITRVIANPNTSGLTSFVGQTEGGWYTEFRTGSVVPASGDIVSINSSAVNSVGVYVNSNSIRLFIYHNSTLILITGPTIAANTSYKCGVRYQSGNIALYVNGVAYTSSASISFTAALANLTYTSGFFIGERYPLLFGTNIFFLTPPTNAELLALTS